MASSWYIREMLVDFKILLPLDRTVRKYITIKLHPKCVAALFFEYLHLFTRQIICYCIINDRPVSFRPSVTTHKRLFIKMAVRIKMIFGVQTPLAYALLQRNLGISKNKVLSCGTLSPKFQNLDLETLSTECPPSLSVI